MIRFKCLYCGQRIAVNDNLAGRHGKCPTCGHELRVPATIRTVPLSSLDSAEREKKAIAELELMNAVTDSSDNTPDLAREDACWLVPVYDEMSLFLMSVTLILLYAVNIPFREQIYNLVATSFNHRYFLYVIAAAAILISGMAVSIFNVFTSRDKTDTEKWIMLIFAVMTNAGIGILSGWYVLSSSRISNWLAVFPLWNIINGILLIVMLRLKIINEDCVSDRNASLKEVVIGLIAVFLIFLLCDHILKLHWAVTLSVCIIYTTSLDKGLQSVFPVLAGQSDEETNEQTPDAKP